MPIEPTLPGQQIATLGLVDVHPYNATGYVPTNPADVYLNGGSHRMLGRSRYANKRSTHSSNHMKLCSDSVIDLSFLDDDDVDQDEYRCKDGSLESLMQCNTVLSTMEVNPLLQGRFSFSNYYMQGPATNHTSPLPELAWGRPEEVWKVSCIRKLKVARFGKV